VAAWAEPCNQPFILDKSIFEIVSNKPRFYDYTVVDIMQFYVLNSKVHGKMIENRTNIYRTLACAIASAFHIWVELQNMG
jgi:hypothetical protein